MSPADYKLYNQYRRDFPYMHAWGRYVGHSTSTMLANFLEAHLQDAPEDVCYRAKEYSTGEEVWICFSQLLNELAKKKLQDLVDEQRFEDAHP